jgi:hypothetical protein
VKRPSTILKNDNKDEDDDDYDKNEFEDDAADTGDDKLEKLRKALDKENQKAVKHQHDKPGTIPSNINNPMVSGPNLMGGNKIALG